MREIERDLDRLYRNYKIIALFAAFVTGIVYLILALDVLGLS